MIELKYSKELMLMNNLPLLALSEHEFRFEPEAWNGCRDLMQKAMINVSFVSGKRNDYGIQFLFMNKVEAIENIIKHKYLLSM